VYGVCRQIGENKKKWESGWSVELGKTDGKENDEIGECFKYYD
jgi:hypothetical protein